MAIEVPGGDVPEEVASQLGELWPVALRALEESVKATVTKRLELRCPECSHAFRKQVQIPSPKARLDAAKFISEQVVGRATPKPQPVDEELERVVFFRSVVPPDEDDAAALLRELAEAVLSEQYARDPRVARELASRVALDGRAAAA